MLKTLRITSLAAVVLAVCGVFLIVFLALREDPEIIAYLEQPGIVSHFKDQAGAGVQKNLESPLVAQAQAFKLRIDPPPPPKPTPRRQPERQPIAERTPPSKPTPPPPPQPKVSTTAKFTLLATVMCEENPNRSMVLLRQAGGKDEWFWQGEKVGNLDVTEVRNGTAVFSQNGRNEQVLSVPAKPKTKSLLKNPGVGSSESTDTSTAGSISVTVDSETGEPIIEPVTETADSATQTPVNTEQQETDTSQSRPELPTGAARNPASVRREVANRIRRIRTVPRQPTPAEQGAKLDDNISRIQQIMNSQSSDDTEQQQAEKEAWMKLLNSLQTEKERLEDTAKQENETTDAEQEGASDNTQSEDPNDK